ncbi:MAG: site-specific integrase [Clostridia bacterium]|nr:site-specific integrase [Clostridia bacterium]
MNNAERLLFLSVQLLTLNAGNAQKKEEIETISSELAALRRQMEEEHGAENDVPSFDNGCVDGFVKFTKKEISHMPIRFRKLFVLGGCTVRAYKRLSCIRGGKEVYNYELRCRSEGYNIYASSNNFERARKKFLEELRIAEEFGSEANAASNFHEFSTYYFETFRKRKVAAETLKNDLQRYNFYLKPAFGSLPLKRITPARCQKLLDDVAAQGKNKTVNELYSLMNVIFNSAIAHNYIATNPLAIVVKESYESEHGSALTKAEEKALLAGTAGTEYQRCFAVALYTGLRPNEYGTAKIEGKFIIAVNSKRKTKRIEYKRIPIIPMLRPYLEGGEELRFPCHKSMWKAIKNILPNHKLYDLRTTFYTRCHECGVADVARMEFVGHSLGKLGDAYTDLSDEFLLKEGAKIFYDLCDNVCDNSEE